MKKIELNGEEKVITEDGVIMKCYRKISVCCKAAVCELGIMCQVGEKIEAECKICEGQGMCEMAFKEEALACERIQKVLSDKEHKDYTERRIRFVYDFCMGCLDRRICKNVCQADKCEALSYALNEIGFLSNKQVEEKTKEENKITQSPVNMDEMQQNIMIELLNARKECTDENLLTARGCIAIIDALFFLVKEGVHIGIDMGDLKRDRTRGSNNEKNK